MITDQNYTPSHIYIPQTNLSMKHDDQITEKANKYDNRTTSQVCHPIFRCLIRKGMFKN